MGKIKWLGMFLAVACIACWVSTVSAQKIDATVLYRQNSDTGYTALVPGFTPAGSVDCAADVFNSVCRHPAQPASGEPSLDVVGTTLSLLLPDGRVAVVNCLDKYSYKGTAINRRGCAMPLVEHVEADFDGHSAKLRWIFSPDSKKTESETYRVIALLDKH